MCEFCFEERLFIGVVDDFEIEEEVVKEEIGLELFENDFVDIELDILIQLFDEEFDFVDILLDLEELEVEEEILLDDEDIKEELEDYEEKIEIEDENFLFEEEISGKLKKEIKFEKKKGKKKNK